MTDLTIESIGQTYEFITCQHCSLREPLGCSPRDARAFAKLHLLGHGISRPTIQRIQA